MPSGPLNGVKILDLTHVWAGPLAVRFLADFGADVVRVEAPFGRGPQEFPYTPLGGWLGGAAGSDPWNTNAIFSKLMRNRRSLCLDLKLAAGREVFLKLVAQADVVMENFSAQAMQNLALGYEVLKAVNPRIIYVAMPGFGTTGPLADRVAFGPTVEAMSGLTDVFGYSAQEPRNTAMALMDPITGTHAFAAVTQALRRREVTGVGSAVEMSLHEGGVNYSGPWLIDRQLGREVETWGNRHPNMVPHGIYRCRGDDQWLALACENDHQWAALSKLLSELPSERLISAEHQDNPKYPADMALQERRSVEDQIDNDIAALTENADKHVLAEFLQNLGIPAGAVNATPDMVADDQVRARGFFVNYERHATPIPGNPIKRADLDTSQWTPCPALGEHNETVLRDWLGYSTEQLKSAQQSGILHDKPPA